MSAFFSDFFRAQLFANQALMNTASIRVALLRQAPSFVDGDARYVGIQTVTDLLTKPGWGEAAATGYPLTNTLAIGVLAQGNNRYVLLNQFPFTGMGQAEVRAAAILYNGTLAGVVNPIIFVTDTPFPEMTVVDGGDGITPSPDSTITGASKRWLFSWATPAAGATTLTTLGEGPLQIFLGPPTFEPSHTQHVWLYPQRANLIANPSFEKPGMGYWSTNGVKAEQAVANPVENQGTAAGRFTGSAPVIAESNLFPTNRKEEWTIQLLAKGNGTLKVGFVWWDDDFAETAVDWGTETWALSSSFVHIAALRNPVQTYQGMIRLECSGTELVIDNVLCEKGYLKEWPYFDGDTTYGARDDFSWYGGISRRGASYSFWYNNKRSLFGRMFDREINDSTLVTDEVMAAQGFVYRWVPAGTFVMAYLDVLYPHDIKAPIPAKAAGVLPYRTDYFNDLNGVVNPWTITANRAVHAHTADTLNLT